MVEHSHHAEESTATKSPEIDASAALLLFAVLSIASMFGVVLLLVSMGAS